MVTTNTNRRAVQHDFVFCLLLFVCSAANGQQTESSSNSLTLSGALIGTALIAVVAVLANIVQFVINAGLLLELRKSRSVAKIHQ